MSRRQAIITVDLGYGDAGKGATVDCLVRRTGAHTVIRYNGGAQAAHNVVTPDGRHHTFAQFGSGMFVPGTRTHLSRFMLLDPLAMKTEAVALGQAGVPDAFERTTIDEDALVITPFQRAANRLKELARGEARHGSCGRGVGETMSDFLTRGSAVLFARDLGAPGSREKLEILRDLKLAELEPTLASLPRTDPVVKELTVFERSDAVELCLARYREFVREARVVGGEALVKILRAAGVSVFEGAQGVLLDEWHGFHPYTTWSTTTAQNASKLLAEAGFDDPVVRLGVVRAYAVRHGPGPFVSEDATLTRLLPDRHNGASPWQREFRVGWFDVVATRYAVEVNGGVDGLAVTCLDRLEALPSLQMCVAYRYRGAASESVSEFFETGGEGEIRRIRVVPAPNLAHQARLAEMLADSEALLGRVGDGAASRGAFEEVLRRMERELDVPMVMTSTGVTALDRQFFDSFPQGLR
jgi:adenylosuccinate synthase